MYDRRLNILLVEDDEDDYVFVRDLLSEIGGRSFDLEWASSYEAAIEVIQRAAHDVYLVDYRLGARNGLEFLREAAGMGCRAPMILLTGQGGPEIDVEAMRAGAADYLTKGRLDSALLERSIRYAVEQRRTLVALRRSEEQFRGLLESGPDAMVIVNQEGCIVMVNSQTKRFFGYGQGELIGQPVEILMPKQFRDRHMGHREGYVADPHARPMGWGMELYGRRKGGEEFPVEISLSPLKTDQGVLIMAAVRDITKRKQAEEARDKLMRELEQANRELKEAHAHLVQSEKMASLGQLVAGIAHEINNPLSFILSNVFTVGKGLEHISAEVAPHLSEPSLKRLEKVRARVGDMRTGLEQVKDLVIKLRTFSRLDEGEFKVADVHEGIDSVLLFLKHKIDGRIQVEKAYGPVSTLACYAGQLNQVLMNVISNAVDAIEGEGRITVATGQEGGRFVISVRDTGRGIPEAIRGRIFEPFFTTKPVGQGTGLGLAISYGIVQAHRGSIEVRSEEGEGTEFIIQIPTNLKEKTRCEG